MFVYTISDQCKTIIVMIMSRMPSCELLLHLNMLILITVFLEFIINIKFLFKDCVFHNWHS